MTQQPLFEFGATSNGPYDSRPLAARSDPATSHVAAERHRRSGKLGRHEEIALALVQRSPGCTRWELWQNVATEDERAELGDSVELMRRLGGMLGKGDYAGKVRHGVSRKCGVKNTSMVTWWLV